MKANTVELAIQDQTAYGENRGLGNLVGIQAWMVTADYRSKVSLEGKLRRYLEAASALEWLNAKSIVVFPEYIGTWLVAAGEAPEVYQAEDIGGAMRILVRKHPLSFLRGLIYARGKDRVKDALFRMKAIQMSQMYDGLFSSLARDFGVTIVAGSIVLPSPWVEGGQLRTGAGPLRNSAVVYRPDGTPHEQVVHKWYPISEEQPFTQAALGTDLPVFETPAGRLGVLICADSWYPEPYANLGEKGCQIIVVPNNLIPKGSWGKPWRGYDPGPAPADVDQADVMDLSEGEAWLKYALPGRIRLSGASNGMHVFFHGKVWDLDSEGHTILVHRGRTIKAPEVEGAAIVNVWL